MNRSLLLLALLCSGISTLHSRASTAPDLPIIYVLQVPMPDNINNIASTFGNHSADPALAPRGGDLMIRYVDGSTKNLTASAGFGTTGANGFQDANAIAVRSPCVHWSGTKALFSMVVGAPPTQGAAQNSFWQLYEVTNFAQGQTPTFTKVPNQPANANNFHGIYANDERILFISDRSRNGAAYLYPQLDEYRLDTTNTGLWSLDPAGGTLFLMSHNPSGSFWPTIDSYGRVILTRWDHLERDVTADADTVSQSGTIKGTFNFSDESAGAQIIPRQDEPFPEPSPVRPELTQGTNVVNMEFNQFFPWQINQDGTSEETINHVGRHELRFALGRVFNDDPNVVNYSSQTTPRFNPNFINNMLQIREDPAHPGIFFGVDANEFGTHAAGQIYSLNGPAGLPADQMKVTYITDRSTEGVTAEGGNPNPNHSGHYRSPLPFLNGALVASHTLETHADFNIGTATAPLSRYNFQIKQLKLSGNVWVSDVTLVPPTVKTVSYYNPGTLITYTGPPWELDPIAVTARTKPPIAANPLGAPEKQILSQENVDETALRTYMAQKGIALIVSRNLTTRDAADKQQPLNLQVYNSTVKTVPFSGKIYDIANLQIFQADQLRGLTGGPGNLPPLPGRRPIPQPLHDPAATNPPNAGAPPGAVKISTLDGSMAAFVPARRALSWQMVDHVGTPVVHERYWLTFQPGEIRTCTSCHGINSVDQVGNTPPTNPPEALRDLMKYYKQITAPPQIASGPTATPNPVGVGVSTQLTVAATGASPFTYGWDLGDGTLLPSGASSVSHTYQTAGTYIAKVTILDSNGLTTSGQVSVYVTTSSTPLQIVNGPTATPSTVAKGAAVQFDCLAVGSAPVTLAWDFGDGSVLPAGVNTTVMHTYSISGVYTATVTAADANANTLSATVGVTVNDAQGNPPTPFTFTKGTLKFNFKTNKDSFSISGTLPLAAGANPTGKTVQVSAGGYAGSATVNVKGAASFKMPKPSKKPKTSGRAFTFSIKNTALYSSFASLGFVNTTTATPLTVKMPIEIVLDGVTYDVSVTWTYTSTAGHSGTGAGH